MYHVLRSAQGEDLRLYAALPSAPGPVVVVLHAWWGLVADFTAACDRLAGSGFFAVAPDLHGGKVAETIAEAERLAAERPAAARVQAVSDTLDWARRQPLTRPGPAGLLGFSLGGTTALRAAARGVGDAVVTFYGTADLGHEAVVKVPVLAHMAEHDPYEPADEAAALFGRLAGQGTLVTVRTWPGTEHWFCEPSREVYQPRAAEEAWGETLRFLDRHLRGETAGGAR